MLRRLFSSPSFLPLPKTAIECREKTEMPFRRTVSSESDFSEEKEGARISLPL
jgi:hypothetical protein